MSDQVNQQWVSGLIQEYGEPVFKNGSSISPNDAYWAGLYAEENRILWEPKEKRFYEYSRENGLWKIVSEESLQTAIAKRLLNASRDNQDFRALERHRSSHRLRAIVTQLKGQTEKPDAFANAPRVIHVANGVLVPDEHGRCELKSFSPDFYSRNQCPIKYDPYATCQRFLSELLRPPLVDKYDERVVQKYFGLCLLGHNPIQRMLILEGASGSGKGTLVKVAAGLAGEWNVVEMRTKHLEERFEIARYIGRTILSGSDVPSDFLSNRSASRLKALVGGDLLDAEIKGGRDPVRIKGEFPILITSNTSLHVCLQGDEDAFRRRLLIVKFRESEAKKIPDFEKVLLEEEGPGILNWVLEGLRLLYKDIEETGNVVLTGGQQGRIDQLLSESLSLKEFVAEVVVLEPGSKLATDEIIEGYQSFCSGRGYKPKPSREVQTSLPDLLGSIHSISQSHDIKRHGKVKRGYRGISLRQ
jgi:putative DNA primase/helicase